MLEIINSGNGVVQKYTTLSQNVYYVRTMTNYIWSAWKSGLSEIQTIINDTIVTVNNIYDLPNIGTPEAIYIIKDENSIYRWDDSELKYYCVGRDYNDTVTLAELSYLSGVTGNIQTQINTKGTSSLTLGTSASNAYRGDYGNTAYTHSQVAHAPSGAQVNQTLTSGDGMAAWTATNGALTITLGTPTTLTNSTTNELTATSHTHSVTFPVTSVNSKTGAVSLTASDVGAASTDDLTDHIGATGSAHGLATTSHAGFMSTGDKFKLDTMSTYTLPTASDSVLGGIKVGSNLSISSGVLSATDTKYTLPAASPTVVGGVKLDSIISTKFFKR